MEADGAKFLLRERIRDALHVRPVELDRRGQGEQRSGLHAAQQVNLELIPAWLHPEITSAHLTMVNDLSTRLFW